ncbi:MAG: PAS domain S-box protein [bacterium]|nr:PAS domain S-box protein [bacterium]
MSAPGPRESDLLRELAAARTECEHHRAVATQLGRKALTDSQDYARLIGSLRETEAELRRSRADLELDVARRTAELTLANQELSAVKRRYEDLVRRIPHGVYTLRITSAGERRFEYVSAHLCELVGCEPEQVMADADVVFAGVHPDDMADLLRLNAASVQDGNVLAWEGRVTAGGGERWLRLEADQTTLPDGDVLWSGVAADITEFRRAQDRLRESEELYRRLNELAPNAITVCDLEGCIRMLNAAALSLFGANDASAVIGSSIWDWVAAGSGAQARQKFTELMTVSRLRGLELELQRADGAAFVARVDASLVCDEQGRPRLVMIVTNDETPRRQLESERLRLQKLEAVGTLAGGLAHDFNNLLQGVFGYISLARLKLADPAAAAELLQHAEKATGQAVNLTSQLLTFAKGGKPQKTRLALPAVVERAAHFALSGSATVCILDAQVDLWDADADEGQAVQVIQNIVMNASQAMQQSGIVGISLRNVDLPPLQDEALPDGGRFVAITFSDSGIGIAAPYLGRIFDPYFTTKQRGSGLGLATAWSIVARHGGTIRVESTPGMGSTFEVLLPAATAAAATPPVEVPAGRRCRVLVMDDEELVREVAVAMLGSLGHLVDEAVDGDEAVRRVECAFAAGHPYDIVILDLTVRGGMGGEEAIGRIRSVAPGIRAVVSSGYSDSAVMADFRAHGFDAFLNKPYTIEALSACLAAGQFV